MNNKSKLTIVKELEKTPEYVKKKVYDQEGRYSILIEYDVSKMTEEELSQQIKVLSARKSVSHQGIINLLDFSESSTTLTIQEEYFEGETLLGVLY